MAEASLARLEAIHEEEFYGKWLKAGVLERSELSRPEAGTPQGGVISPLLANIYVHEVIDDW